MLAFVCIICSLVASLLYTYAGEPDGMPLIAAQIAGYLLSASIALWVRGDLQKRHRTLPYDLDSFVFFFWPIAAPVYLLRTRGWRGCGPIVVGFIILLVVVVLESRALFDDLAASPR